MADTTNKRIILHDLLGANLYPVTSASLVSGLDAKIKDLIAKGFSIELGTFTLGTNNAITGITLTTNATDGTAKLNFTTGTIHTGGKDVSGFVKITTDANGHVTLGTAVTVDDVLNLNKDVTDTAKRIATEKYVDDKFKDDISVAQALYFKGTANESTTFDDDKLGAVYIASSDFTFNGEKVEAGDMIVCTKAKDDDTNAEYKVIQRNLDGALTTSNPIVENNLVVGDTGNNTAVKDSGISLSSVVRLDSEIADNYLVIGAGTNTVKKDNDLTVGALKSSLNLTATKVDAGKVWTSTASGGEWADPLKVKAGEGIDITGETAEKTIALKLATPSTSNGTAINLTTGTGSVNAVTGVSVDSYGRVTSVETTSFSVTLPAVPVQGASDGLKLDGTTVKHNVTLTTSTNAVTLKFGTTFTADTVTRDAYGHVTNVNTTTFTLPAAPEEVIASGDSVVLATRDGNEIKVSHSTKLGSDVTVGNNTTGTANHGTTINIPSISVDTYGHVTAASDVAITLPSDQNTFDKIDGKVVPSDKTLADTGLVLGTLSAGVGSTIHLGTGLALMPGTNASASIVAALTYTVVDAGVAGGNEIFT